MAVLLRGARHVSRAYPLGARWLSGDAKPRPDIHIGSTVLEVYTPEAVKHEETTITRDLFEAERLRDQKILDEKMRTPTIIAYSRANQGRNACADLRAKGRMPGLVFSTTANADHVKVHCDAKEIAKARRLNGLPYLYTKYFNMEIYAEPSDAKNLKEPPSDIPLEVVRVVPKLISVDSVSNVIEDISFMRAPPGQTLKVQVPVRVTGQDLCPGIKRGGWLNVIKRKIACICDSDNIPRAFTVDVSKMEVGEKVMLSDMEIPTSCHVRNKQKYAELPVVMISGKARRA